MRIVFFGTPEFAAHSLRRIVEAGHEVAAVVTATDKPAGRGHKLLPSAVKQAALELGLPVLQPERLRDKAFIGRLRELGADLFVVIAFRMMPEAVWSMPRLGTFNLHASLLPRYRGAAPINRAVMNGDTVTGVTTFFINRDIDTGEIIQAVETPIGPDETAGDVHDRLMTIGADLTLQTLEALERGPVATQPQRDEEATEAPKILAETMQIDWREPAERVRNLIRGLAPYPGARATLEGLGEVKLLRAGRPEVCSLAPGQWQRTADGRMLVGCGDGRGLEIFEIKPAGKRAMPAADFLRGLRL